MAMEPIMNPNNLKVEGFRCIDQFDNRELILVTQDIRDHIKDGFVIDDHEVLVEPEELVRLKDVLKLNFILLGKPVYTDKKKRLGKVVDYAVDNETLYVQKLYVSQTILKSLNAGQLTIDRSQIVEITDRRVIVKDPLQGVKDTAPATALA